MATDAREKLAELLAGSRSAQASFATRRTMPVGDLSLVVGGVGDIALPIKAAQAKALRLVARPAKVGIGENTVLDRRVRDTWEIPKSRVRIDKRRWNRTLDPVLDDVRDDLGLASTARLRAELHSMLVYEPQQFFAAHQDSEKSDSMVGSLVVMLPSNARGGDFIVEHGGDSFQYRGSATHLTFVAFYGDTRHEVLPVEQGYRVVLTYNLMVADGTGAHGGADAALVAEAVALMEQHFSESPESRWPNERDALEPPDRLVVLLDHRYTERGLRWSALKGDDIAYATVIASAAQDAACEVGLAHATVHETWDWSDGDRGWRDSDDDHGTGELGDLIDSHVEIVASGSQNVTFETGVSDSEFTSIAPLAASKPDDSEYTGYMGNWGNTMDRWYQRAAIVIWPRSRAFALRAKADPASAVHELLAAIEDRPADAREMAETLLRFWDDGVRGSDHAPLAQPSLRLALALDDDAVAGRLLDPLAIEAFGPDHASTICDLVGRYGVDWFAGRVTAWMSHRRSWRQWPPSTDRTDWVASLADFGGALIRARPVGDADALGAVGVLADQAWAWLEASLRATAQVPSPSRRTAGLADLGGPLLAVLRSASIARNTELHGRISATAVDPVLDLTSTLAAVMALANSDAPKDVAGAGLEPIATHLVATLRDELGLPERSPGDWAIAGLSNVDCCGDCGRLASFLADKSAQTLTWPLAKPRRQHMHQRLAEAELPVTHHTVRQGSPHKLVLTKTDGLFDEEAARRTTVQSWLVEAERLVESIG